MAIEFRKAGFSRVTGAIKNPVFNIGGEVQKIMVNGKKKGIINVWKPDRDIDIWTAAVIVKNRAYPIGYTGTKSEARRGGFDLAREILGEPRGKRRPSADEPVTQGRRRVPGESQKEFEKRVGIR